MGANCSNCREVSKESEVQLDNEADNEAGILRSVKNVRNANAGVRGIHDSEASVHDGDIDLVANDNEEMTPEFKDDLNGDLYVDTIAADSGYVNKIVLVQTLYRRFISRKRKTITNDIINTIVFSEDNNNKDKDDNDNDNENENDSKNVLDLISEKFNHSDSDSNSNSSSSSSNSISIKKEDINIHNDNDNKENENEIIKTNESIESIKAINNPNIPSNIPSNIPILIPTVTNNILTITATITNPTPTPLATFEMQKNSDINILINNERRNIITRQEIIEEYLKERSSQLDIANGGDFYIEQLGGNDPANIFNNNTLNTTYKEPVFEIVQNNIDIEIINQAAGGKKENLKENINEKKIIDENLNQQFDNLEIKEHIEENFNDNVENDENLENIGDVGDELENENVMLKTNPNFNPICEEEIGMGIGSENIDINYNNNINLEKREMLITVHNINIEYNNSIININENTEIEAEAEVHELMNMASDRNNNPFSPNANSNFNFNRLKEISLEIDTQTDKSLDLFNYEKLIHSCESFFIRNSYETGNNFGRISQPANNNMEIINNFTITNNNTIVEREQERDRDSYTQNSNLNFTIESNTNLGMGNSEPTNNKIKRVIKTVVRKIIKSPNNPELIKSKVKKAVFMFTILAKKDKKLKRISTKNFFRIWKEKAKDNFELRKKDIISKARESHLGKILRRKVISANNDKLQSKFNQWYRKVLKIRSNKQIANMIIRKILLFRDKFSVHYYFRDWVHRVEMSSEKVKHSLWKEALMKRSQSVRKLYNRRREDAVKVTSDKFCRWKEFMQRTNEAEIELKTGKSNTRNNNIIDQINTLIKTSDDLKSLVDRITFRRFIKNFQRKAEWEHPKGKHRGVKCIKFFLKSGEVESVVKTNKIGNVFWKYVKPLNLKYYLYKFYFIANRLKIKELEGKSQKWKIEEKTLKDKL